MPEELISPSRTDFLRLAATHSLVPVYRTLTPTWRPLFPPFCASPPTNLSAFCWNPSREGRRSAAIHLSASGPTARSSARGSSMSVYGERQASADRGRCFRSPEGAAGRTQTCPRIPALPPFTAGAVGFFSYDVVRQIERLPSLAEDDLGLPDACLMFFDEILAFDHVRKEILLIVTADLYVQKPRLRMLMRQDGWAG